MSNYSPEEIDELLSAYLDNELSGVERTQVDNLLANDPEVQQHLDELESTRSLVRGLPTVEPRRPLELPQVTEPKPRRSRTLGWVATAAVSVAAVWLLVIGLVGGGDLRVVPDVEALELRHASATDAPMDGGFAPMDSDEIKMKQFVPDTIGFDMDRAAIYQRENLVQAVFSDGAHAVSVFHEPGPLDWDAMPAGFEVMDMPDGKAWHQTSEMGNVLVTEKAGQIVTIVADADMGDDMVFSIPDLL